MTTKRLAKVTRTFLGLEGHGILTAYLIVDYGGSSQSIGGYALHGVGTVFLERILSACGVESWEALVGRTIYVLTDDAGRVVGVENLPTENGNAFLFAEVSS